MFIILILFVFVVKMVFVWDGKWVLFESVKGECCNVGEICSV